MNLTNPYDQGYLSGYVGDARSSCPYDDNTVERARWLDGYDVGKARRIIMDDLDQFLPETC